MKKSELLKLAELSVLANEELNEDYKLDVLKVLIDEERLALISEKIEEEKKNG